MARNVVAFVGESESGAQMAASRDLMRILEPLGLAAHLISFADPNWMALLQALMREGIVVGWGAAGLGANLGQNGESFWDVQRIPFVSAFAEPPCRAPKAHRPASRNIVLGYVFDEWLDIQRRFVRAPNVCAKLPSAVAPNPYRDRIPWSQRSHRMVFVKTGVSPAARRAQWAARPARVRAVLEDAATEACRHGTMGLTDLLLDAMAAHSLMLDGRVDVLMSLMHELDVYVRAERSTRMVQALSRLPAKIVGRGWDHIDRSEARATFHPPLPATQLPELMADTQFVVNTTPNVASGTHERVLAGFAARACVVSDLNDYLRASFACLPSFFGVEWHTDDLADCLASVWAMTEDLGPATDLALNLTETVFAPINVMKAILELGEIGLLSMNMSNELATERRAGTG
jgi:hypothetical protein